MDVPYSGFVFHDLLAQCDGGINPYTFLACRQESVFFHANVTCKATALTYSVITWTSHK